MGASLRHILRKTALAGLVLIAAVPVHATKAVGLKPAGSPAEWVSPDDYPPAALRTNEQGVTGFRLDVDGTGAVTRCTVTSSSGAADLDETACRVIPVRARFSPARDRKGRPIAATFSSVVRWSIPKDDGAEATGVPSCAPAAGGDIQVITPAGCQH